MYVEVSEAGFHIACREPGLVWSTSGPGEKDQEIKMKWKTFPHLQFLATETLHRNMTYFCPHDIISSNNTHMNTHGGLNLHNKITQMNNI